MSTEEYKAKRRSYSTAHYHRNQEAINAKKRADRAADPEAARAKARAYYRANPERYLGHNRKWQQAHPGQHRASARSHHLRKTYGLTLDQEREYIIGQAGHCLVCWRIPDRLVVDHDHATGAIRGLICQSCNRMLGDAHDSPSTLRSAAEYLERSA